MTNEDEEIRIIKNRKRFLSVTGTLMEIVGIAGIALGVRDSSTGYFLAGSLTYSAGRLFCTDMGYVYSNAHLLFESKKWVKEDRERR